MWVSGDTGWCRSGAIWSGRALKPSRELTWSLRGPLRSMVKDEELVWRERELSVRLALVIRELDFVGAVQELHDGADLTAQEAVRGHV
jgi:hypothetical protein